MAFVVKDVSAEKLYARLKARGDAMVEKGASATARFMKEVFDRSIAGFYDDYDPIYYKRHYNMDKGGQAFTRSYKGGMKFGGIKLDSRRIPSVYHDSPTYVFYESTLAGWHGGTGIFSSPSPWNELVAAVDMAAEYRKALIK